MPCLRVTVISRLDTTVRQDSTCINFFLKTDKPKKRHLFVFEVQSSYDSTRAS